MSQARTHGQNQINDDDNQPYLSGSLEYMTLLKSRLSLVFSLKNDKDTNLRG